MYPQIQGEVPPGGDGACHLVFGWYEGQPLVGAVAPSGERVYVVAEPERIAAFCWDVLTHLGRNPNVA